MCFYTEYICLSPFAAVSIHTYIFFHYRDSPIIYYHPVPGLLCSSQHTTWNKNAQGKRLWDLFYSFNSFSIWLTFRQLAGDIRQSRSQATSSSTWQVDHFTSILWFSTFKGILRCSSVLKLLDLLLVSCPVHEWLYWRQASSCFNFIVILVIKCVHKKKSLCVLCICIHLTTFLLKISYCNMKPL